MVPAACCGTVLAIVALVVGRDYPLVGHDYRYFIPRLLDTDLHLRLNGLAVQWYTPTFGGGLPAFPNPQHIQYSLLQAATFFLGPWTAVIVTTVLVSAIGCAALYRALRLTLGLGTEAATLGMVCFAGNGFFIEHVIVGHVGFQLFPLSAVMFDSLVDSRRRPASNGAILALAATAMLHQAGFYLLIIVALSVVLTISCVHVWRPDVPRAGRLVRAMAMGLALTVLIAGSKILAVVALMRQFPRPMTDIYDAGLLEAGAGLLAQLFGVMSVTPLLVASGVDVSLVTRGLWKLTGVDARYGIWELDTGVSPAVPVAIAVVIAHAALTRRRTTRTAGAHPNASLIMLAVGVWVAIELATGRGYIFNASKSLPIFSSLHVHHRFAASFILPLTVGAAFAFERWRAIDLARRAMPLVMILAVVSPASYYAFPRRTHLRTFDVSSSIQTAAAIRDGQAFPVERIADVEDAQTFEAGASSRRPYEPLFGYYHETFAARTWTGRADEVKDGAFNLTNPASLVYPAVNGARPFDRIHADDRAAFDAFVARRQPGWKVSALQSVAGALAVPALLLCLVLMGAETLRSRSRTQQ